MFGRLITNYEEKLRLEKERLNNMSEKELLVELILEIKKIDRKCDDIALKPQQSKIFLQTGWPSAVTQ